MLKKYPFHNKYKMYQPVELLDDVILIVLNMGSFSFSISNLTLTSFSSSLSDLHSLQPPFLIIFFYYWAISNNLSNFYSTFSIIYANVFPSEDTKNYDIAFFIEKYKSLSIISTFFVVDYDFSSSSLS